VNEFVSEPSFSDQLNATLAYQQWSTINTLRLMSEEVAHIKSKPYIGYPIHAARAALPHEWAFVPAGNPRPRFWVDCRLLFRKKHKGRIARDSG
jgi:hypothetical protein